MQYDDLCDTIIVAERVGRASSNIFAGSSSFLPECIVYNQSALSPFYQSALQHHYLGDVTPSNHRTSTSTKKAKVNTLRPRSEISL